MAPTAPDVEMARWRSRIHIAEFDLDQLAYAADRAARDGWWFPADGDQKPGSLAVDVATLASLGVKPLDVRTFEENVLVTAGVTRILNLAGSLGGTAWSATVGRILVGDGGGSAPTAAASDTDLVAAVNAANRYGQLFSAAPTVSGTPATFQASATVATGNGNFHWFEWAIDQGTASAVAAATAPLLNHKGVDMGTKPSSVAWSITAQIQIS